MVYCLNPICPNPENLGTNQFCLSCGTKLIPLLENRYQIIKKLGRGGFGITYLAEDKSRLNATCVIKQFSPIPEIQRNPQTLQKAIELFSQEAERLLQLGEEHPQIPTLFAYFEQDKQLYLVQQLIKGRNLLEELKQIGFFNEKQIRELLLNLLPIIQFIHEHDVIHRDIKPENIIRRQSDGKLVLIDFGVSKQMQGTVLTQLGTTTGTAGYAPSEQMLYGEAYRASDLYSLGATCIHLLTGTHPFYLFNPREHRWLWREQLAQRNVTISDNLGLILDKLLKDIRERYQSANEVLQALHSSVAPTILSPIPTPSVAPTILTIPEPQLKVFNFDVVTLNAQGKEIKRQRKQAEFFSEDLGNRIILEMVAIGGGKFMMGSPNTEKERDNDESPQHSVTIAPFFMSKYPITQAQWKAVAALPQSKIPLNPNPSKFNGTNLPVETISWYEAREFCARLSQKTGRNYRLPSEAEWEYAARAGTTTPFHFGETITTDLANYNGNYTYAAAPSGTYRQKTTPVGSFGVANAFGLYDIHGNVWEWCVDPWHENYNDAPLDGSVWESGINNQYRRLLRGGSWFNYPELCRSANRLRNVPDYGLDCFGFRVALS